MSQTDKELWYAARRGDLRRVRSLLASGANADYQNKLGKTPLIEAAWKGNFDVVKDLLAHGAAVDQADWNGYTPLHWASSYGNLDVVNELLAHGATVDPINKNDETPLHQAASKGEVDIVERLLDGDANRLLENKDGKTPRDLGNDDVKALFDTYQPKTKLYSIHEATDVIRQAIADIHATSDTLAIGSAILNLSLKAQVLRQRVLATALLVEAAMRQNMRQESVDPSPALSSVLQDIQLCFETKLVTTQSWKMTFSVQMVDELRGKMDNLDARLAKAAKFNVCYQVHGTIDDLRHAPGKMMDKMDSIDEHLALITAMSKHRQTDSLFEFAIQVQRGLENYHRHVEMGNIQRNVDFEAQVEVGKSKIWRLINLMGHAEPMSTEQYAQTHSIFPSGAFKSWPNAMNASVGIVYSAATSYTWTDRFMAKNRMDLTRKELKCIRKYLELKREHDALLANLDGKSIITENDDAVRDSPWLISVNFSTSSALLFHPTPRSFWIRNAAANMQMYRLRWSKYTTRCLEAPAQAQSKGQLGWSSTRLFRGWRRQTSFYPPTSKTKSCAATHDVRPRYALAVFFKSTWKFTMENQSNATQKTWLSSTLSPANICQSSYAAAASSTGLSMAANGCSRQGSGFKPIRHTGNGQDEIKPITHTTSNNQRYNCKWLDNYTVVQWLVLNNLLESSQLLAGTAVTPAKKTSRSSRPALTPHNWTDILSQISEWTEDKVAVIAEADDVKSIDLSNYGDSGRERSTEDVVVLEIPSMRRLPDKEHPMS
ncbi:hypothetical protein Ae201684P_003497 [Aphanomyces euteiches]|nr:hypothetical protein Ae201684P_003497 [Aphanomyces euteiches]